MTIRKHDRQQLAAATSTKRIDTIDKKIQEE
jgi:hypothetical protein